MAYIQYLVLKEKSVLYLIIRDLTQVFIKYQFLILMNIMIPTRTVEADYSYLFF